MCYVSSKMVGVVSLQTKIFVRDLKIFYDKKYVYENTENTLLDFTSVSPNCLGLGGCL